MQTRPHDREVAWHGMALLCAGWVLLLDLQCIERSHITITLASGIVSVRSCTMMSRGIQANDRASVHMGMQ